MILLLGCRISYVSLNSPTTICIVLQAYASIHLIQLSTTAILYGI